MTLTPRQQPPAKRRSISDKIRVVTKTGQMVVFVRISLDKDDMPCELFIDTAKEGTQLRALMSSFAMAISLALQHGASLAECIHMLRAFREEPIIEKLIHFLNTYHLPNQIDHNGNEITEKD